MHPTLYKRIEKLAMDEEQTNSSVRQGKSKGQAKAIVTQPVLEDAILQFIIKERIPLSKLNSDSLNNLIKGGHLFFYSILKKFSLY